MKKTLITLILFISSIVFGQIGMSNPNPRGALDINKDTTNTMGLVLPTNSDVNNIITPQGGNVIPGTIIYDSAQDCVRYYKKIDQWSDCVQFPRSKILKATVNNQKDTVAQILNIKHK